jgi:hypothetical protein
MKSERRYDTPNRDEVNGEIREKSFQTRSEMDPITLRDWVLTQQKILIIPELPTATKNTRIYVCTVYGDSRANYPMAPTLWPSLKDETKQHHAVCDESINAHSLLRIEISNSIIITV